MPTLKDNNSLSREPSPKVSSVMYKTTFSSQAKDVRRGGKPAESKDKEKEKENVPKFFDCQGASRKIASRKPRIGLLSKKAADSWAIGSLRRCFKDGEECADEGALEIIDAQEDQVDSLCAEVAALKTISDADSNSADDFCCRQGSTRGALASRSRSPPHWDAPPVLPLAARGRPSPASGRHSPCIPPIQVPGRESPTTSLSPRTSLEEPTSNRSSPCIRVATTRAVERISPSKQRPIPPAARTIRRQGPPNAAVCDMRDHPTGHETGPKRAQSAPPPPVERLAEKSHCGPAGCPTSAGNQHHRDSASSANRPTRRSPTPTSANHIAAYNAEKGERVVHEVVSQGLRATPLPIPNDEKFPPPSTPPPGDITSAKYSSPTTTAKAELSSNAPAMVDTMDLLDTRKRKVAVDADHQPRRSRRMSESLPSPPRSPAGGSSEFVVQIPRSPSPGLPSEFNTCPSPPLVGPYSPPAPRQRRSSLSSPSSPMPPMCFPTVPPMPVGSPLLPEIDRQRLAGHEEWLQKQLALLSPCVPNRGGANDADWEDSDHSDDDDSEAEGPPLTVPGGGTVAPAVNSKYFAEIYARFLDCKRLNHLPTLNLCFNLLDTVLMLGNKKTLSLLLRPSSLPKLLAAMQYNPKLNGLASSRGNYLDTMGKRLVAVSLPNTISDLAVTLYQLLFLKDTIIPVVCDETRYLNLNMFIMRTKAKLCQAVFEDRQLLPRLLGDLRQGTLSSSSRTDYLRFLKEFLELGITSYPGEGAHFWRGILRDHQLLPLLTDLLADDCHPVRRAVIDICLLLCDEESRKILFSIIPQHPQFITRLFEPFCDADAPESTLLQLQATIPMLAASPHSDTLPVFYDAAQQVLGTWLKKYQAHRILPCPTHIGAFMELLSLAIHHHHRTFHFSHEGCVLALIDFCALIWIEVPAMPHSALIAANKGILSILHTSNDAFHQYLAKRDVFRGMLKIFVDGNNLITSSMLTLLHTILQLEIQPLIEHVCHIWFGGRPVPHYRSLSFVQQLFLERHRPVLTTPAL